MKREQSTDDRRQVGRSHERAHVVLRIPEQVLEGNAQNHSASGVLLHTDGSLQIEVEIESGEGTRRLTGRLVRSERVDDQRQGWAIQF